MCIRDSTSGGYQPSWVEIGIMISLFGLFGFLYFMFLQFAPIVSIWEVREGEHIAHLDKTIGTSESMLRAMPEES